MGLVDNFIKKVQVTEAYLNGDLSLEDAKREWALLALYEDFEDFVIRYKEYLKRIKEQFS